MKSSEWRAPAHTIPTWNKHGKEDFGNIVGKGENANHQLKFPPFSTIFHTQS